MRQHIPTDREILRAIYDKYLDTFIKYDKEKPNRITKIYVPIDARLIAQQLGVDGDIVFSRLYYYLQKQHGYKEDGIEVPFFKFELSLAMAEEPNGMLCIFLCSPACSRTWTTKTESIGGPP
jgi:hypothetical protein